MTNKTLLILLMVVLAIPFANEAFANTPILDTIPDQRGLVGEEISFTVSATVDLSKNLEFFAYYLRDDTSSNAALPFDGVKFDRSTGEFTWTPIESQIGEHTIEFVAYSYETGDYENGVSSSRQGVTFTISDQKDTKVKEQVEPPTNSDNPIVITNIPDYNGYVNNPISFTVSATDSDVPAQDLVFSILSGSATTANIDSITGEFTWTPTTTGTSNISFRVHDGDEASNDIEIVKFIITDPEVPDDNEPPVISNLPFKQYILGDTISYTVTASNPETDQILSFGFVGDSYDGATIDSKTGEFIWTPTIFGLIDHYIIVYDGPKNNGNTKSDTFNIKSNIVGTELPVLVLTGDNPQTMIQGDDYQELGASCTYLENEAKLDIDARELDTTTVGKYNVEYYCNGGNDRVSETRIIDVVSRPTTTNTQVDEPPILNTIPDITITEYHTELITVSTSNSIENVEYSLTKAPNFVTISGDTITASPENNLEYSSYLIEVKATNLDDGSSDLEDFVIHINKATISSNTPPTLNEIPNYTGVVDGPISFTVSATDVNTEQTLSYSIIKDTLSENAAIDSVTGEFTWTPTNIGTNTIIFQVSDGIGLSSIAVQPVEFTITENNPPVFDIPDYNGYVNEEISFTVSATDPDVPAQDLVFSILSGSATTANIDSITGVFTWTPTKVGNDKILFLVSDGITEPIVQQLVSFTILESLTFETNTAPTLEKIGNKNFNVGEEISFTVSATDPDVPFQTLSYFITDSNDNPISIDGATINESTGLFTWTPTASGLTTFNFIVYDGPKDSDVTKLDNESVIFDISLPEIITPILAESAQDITDYIKSLELDIINESFTIHESLSKENERSNVITTDITTDKTHFIISTSILNEKNFKWSIEGNDRYTEYDFPPLGFQEDTSRYSVVIPITDLDLTNDVILKFTNDDKTVQSATIYTATIIDPTTTNTQVEQPILDGLRDVTVSEGTTQTIRVSPVIDDVDSYTTVNSGVVYSLTESPDFVSIEDNLITVSPPIGLDKTDYTIKVKAVNLVGDFSTSEFVITIYQDPTCGAGTELVNGECVPSTTLSVIDDDAKDTKVKESIQSVRDSSSLVYGDTETKYPTLKISGIIDNIWISDIVENSEYVIIGGYLQSENQAVEVLINGVADETISYLKNTIPKPDKVIFKLPTGDFTIQLQNVNDNTVKSEIVTISKIDDIICDDCIIGTDIKTIAGHSDDAVKTVKISSVDKDTTHLYVEVEISNDVQTFFVHLYTNDKLLSTAEKDVWGETTVKFLLDLNEYDQYIFEKGVTLKVILGTNTNHLVPYYITTENTIETDVIEPAPKKSGGSSNDWKKKPTFGKSWEITSSQIVEDGFTFNGYTLDITDNWHTDFVKTSSIIGDTNHVKMKLYTDKLLKYVTLSLGIPEIGDVSNAETDIIVHLQRNYNNIQDYDITEIVHEQKESLVNPEYTVSNISKVKCTDTAKDNRCYQIEIDFTVMAPLKSDVLAISAVDTNRRNTVTYINEGVEFIGESLLESKTHSMTIKNGNQYPAEIITLTQQDRRYNTYEDNNGYLWSVNEYGSWTQITQPDFVRNSDAPNSVMTRIHSGFSQMIIEQQEKALLVFDSTSLISELPDSISLYSD